MKRKYLIICTVAIGIICFACICFVSFRPKSQYVRIPLVPFPGIEYIPCSINDNGQIVGVDHKPGIRCDVILCDANTEGNGEICFSDNQCRYIDPVGINNSCQFAGTIKDTNGVGQPFLWDPKSGLQMLSTFCELESEVFGINNHGHTVGYSKTPERQRHAVLWTDKIELKDLGTLGGSNSIASSINDIGQVVGYSQVAAGQWHVFIWDINTGMKDIGTTAFERPPRKSLYMNNNGFVVGLFGSATDQKLVSTWSRAKGIRSMPTFEGDVPYARALNDAGQILLVVRSEALMGLVPSIEQYIWTPDRDFLSLGTYIRHHRAPGYYNLVDINNNGQILGCWNKPLVETQTRGVLFNPTVWKSNEGIKSDG